MGAVAFTKVSSSQNQLVYSWTGDAAGTLAYATILADCVAGSPMEDRVKAAGGTTDSNAKAVSALLSGESYTGLIAGTHIQANLIQHTGAAALPLLTAVDNGAGNSPDLVITVAAQGTGLVFLTHQHTLVQ